MKTLTLAKPWSYVTPTVTVDYPAGDHEVTNEIHAAAVKAGATEDTTDGDRTAAEGAAGSTGKSKG